MQSRESKSEHSYELLKAFGVYALKAFVVVGLLFGISHLAAALPAVGVGVVWALLTAVSSVSLAYYAVMKKTHRQTMLNKEGRLSKINQGRIWRLIISFVISAVCMASLIFALPRWSWPEWVLVVIAIPGYYLVSLLVTKVLKRQYEPLYQVGRVVLISGVITGLLLCAAYGIVAYFQPMPTFATAEAALAAADNPFEESPSALMVEAGHYMAYVEAFVAYGQGQVAQYSYGLYVLWRFIAVVSAFFGVASLLSVCALRFPEIRRIFAPLESAALPSQSSPVIKKYVIVACVLPLCLVVAFVVVDRQFANVSMSQEYHEVQEAVQEQAKITAYMLDGKYYDVEAFQALMDEARTKSAALYSEGAATLEPLINDLVDKQLENVDAYLDWYYSLPADYERLAQMFTGTIEDGMKAQLESHINEGVDDTALMSQLENYTTQAEELNGWFREELAACELVDVPEWDMVVVRDVPKSFTLNPLEPSQKLLHAGSRMGVSAGAGVVAGFVTTAAVKKVIAKPFFSKIVTRIATALSSRAAATAAGTVVAPGVGTVIGTALGFVIDFGALKIDEAMNRESYKAEIVDALESQRSELLTLFDDGDTQDDTASDDESPTEG